MKSIVLIIPYFGKFPKHFYIWLTSVLFNPTIDFLILTDAVWTGEMPENVRMVQMSWKTVCKRVKRVCGSDIVLHEPYKLCDYKPVYGEIFSTEIRQYDFWGHCDLDMVFGDIRKFTTEKILENYDRIFTRGHFCLYRNTPEINRRYRKTAAYAGISYKDAFHTRYSCHFDEGNSMRSIFLPEDGAAGTYDEICFADISYRNYPFRLAQDVRGSQAPQIYKWKKGKLTRYYLEGRKICEDEFMYIHLQKRRMKISVQNPLNGFLIVPNEFCEEHKITPDYIQENSRESAIYRAYYFKLRMSSIWKNIRNGALAFRLSGKTKGR